MADIDIVGLEQLYSELMRLGDIGEELEGEALQKGGEIIKEEMQQLVHLSDKQFDTYTFKRGARKGTSVRKPHPHIRETMVVEKPSKDDMGNLTVAVGPNKKLRWRAKFLELGTSKMAPRPFMEPAFEAKKESAGDLIRDYLMNKMGL